MYALPPSSIARAFASPFEYVRAVITELQDAVISRVEDIDEVCVVVTAGIQGDAAGTVERPCKRVFRKSIYDLKA